MSYPFCATRRYSGLLPDGRVAAWGAATAPLEASSAMRSLPESGMSAPADPLLLAKDLSAELSLGEDIVRFPDGSLPVFAAGREHVVKLFPEHAWVHCATETAALQLVDGQLSVPVPAVIHSGTREGWHFIVMTRLQGAPLSSVWPTLRHNERRQLALVLGTALAELHGISPTGCCPASPDWRAFMSSQREGCRAKQEGHGLAARWLDQIDDYLSRWMPQDSGARALLHTEVMREHVLAARDGIGWRLSGLLDFEPAMSGDTEYEFASVGIFVGCGEPGILKAVLEGYGQLPDSEWRERVMCYALLHRYSNLKWYMDRIAGSANQSSLESLAGFWFNV